MLLKFTNILTEIVYVDQLKLKSCVRASANLFTGYIILVYDGLINLIKSKI